MKQNKINEIYERLGYKPFLRLIETSVTRIPERLEELDYALFIIFNTLRSRFELHSLDNKGSSLSFVIPYDTLDSRTIGLFMEGNLKNRNLKDIVVEADKHNELMEKREEKYRKGELNAMAREIRPVFKKLAEEVY